MSTPLTTTSYAVLGLLSVAPMSAYELARQYSRSMRWNWPISEAHLYAEPKRLAAAGLVDIRRVPIGPRRTRQEYRITRRGRAELRRWLASDAVPPPSLHHELLLRVGFADQGRGAHLAASVAASRADMLSAVREGVEQLEGYLAGGGPFPDRLHLIALLTDFHARLLELFVTWADEVAVTSSAWDATQAQGLTPAARRQLEESLARCRRLLERAESPDRLVER